MSTITRVGLVAAVSLDICNGHGHMTYPPNRVGGTLSDGGDCAKGQCGWFSQVAEIAGEPTLDDQYRTINVHARGVHDLTKKNPWRSPGSAPVRGSGCGVSGGGPPIDGTGPLVQPGTLAGQDGASLPRKEATVWKAGSVQEVAWAMNANHNGGYSWRLCKNNAPKVAPQTLPVVQPSPNEFPQCVADPTGKTSSCKKCSDTVSWGCDECRDGCARNIKGEGDVFVGSLCSCNPDPKNATPPEPIDPGVTEECFQQNTLKFATDSSWIQFTNGTRYEFPLTKVTEGTHPAGSNWAKNPIPTCLMADRYDKCGPGIEPHGAHDDAYLLQAWCAGYCNGQSVHHVDADGMSHCPAGTDNYPPLSGIAGYGYKGSPEEAGTPFPWSIVDKMEVPKDLETGDYFLSWRWDCEQGSQIWQGCADILIEGDDSSMSI